MLGKTKEAKKKQKTKGDSFKLQTPQKKNRKQIDPASLAWILLFYQKENLKYLPSSVLLKQYGSASHRAVANLGTNSTATMLAKLAVI